MKLTALFFVALVLAFATHASARDAFAGTWDVTVTPDDEAVRAKAREFKDVGVVNGSQRASAEMKKQGFEAATYDEDTRGGITATFKCEMKNKKGEKAVWSGMSTGVDLTGELTWTKEDGTELKYTLKGTKKQ